MSLSQSEPVASVAFATAIGIPPKRPGRLARLTGRMHSLGQMLSVELRRLVQPGKRRSALTIVLVALAAFVLQGYHPGAEDDGIYLSAIKKKLDMGLYPYNASFFMAQMKATIFDNFVAWVVRLTHLPVSYACLLLQILGIICLLAGCWRIAGYCFPSYRARVAGIVTVGCLLTLSVAGTAIYVSDEHLHPRLLATDAIVFAIAATQRRRGGQAVLLLLIAMLFHPIMGAFGVSFCAMYWAVDAWMVRQHGKAMLEAEKGVKAYAGGIPGAWLFAPITPAWHQALGEHSYYRLARWTWYEWLGALAPPLLLGLMTQAARRAGNRPLMRIAMTLTVFSTAQLAIGMAMLLPAGTERLYPLQPMRYLHLTFLLMFLLAGAALGEYVLRRHAARWLLVFVPLAGLNGYAQRMRYPDTRNLEMPWDKPSSDWLRAFAWVKANTPRNAVFALDPEYLTLPGDDYHSFRALAERSSLVDDLKDAAEVTQVANLAPTWLLQHQDEDGWKNWTGSNFAQLARETPVRWVLVSPREGATLECPYRNASVWVCRIG